MAKPFLRWAGGKTQLIDIIDQRIGDFREKSDGFIYVEPFVGGGSVLLHLLDTCSNLRYAVINDANEQLMNTYRIISDNDKYNLLKDELRDIQNQYNSDDMKKEKYELYRIQYNHWMKGDNNMSDIWGAAVFMFLNKCSFNGLYRVNKKGEFNTPWGQKASINLLNEDELDKIHILLNEKVAILSGDYYKTNIMLQVAKAEKLDIIYYLDPPYKPISETSAFVSYTKDSFGDEDQQTLKKFCDEVDKEGGKFLLSNSKCDDYFDMLYSEYEIETVLAKRQINSVGTKRGAVNEVLIHN